MGIALLGLIAIAAAAEDRVLAVDPARLEVAGGRLPAGAVLSQPWVEGGEALVADGRLLLRLGPAAAATGSLAADAVAGGIHVFTPVVFRVPAGDGGPEARRLWQEADRRRCLAALDAVRTRGGPLPDPAPGLAAAWWRWRARAAGASATEAAGASRSRRSDDLAEAMALFTGTRALAENLAFDHRVETEDAGGDAVDLAALPGVRTRAIDWAPLMPDGIPDPDPLAARLPADQYAVLVPSFSALMRLVDRLDGLLGGPQQLIEGGGEDAGVRTRYQVQMGLEVSELAKRFGPELVQSAALTGGDPFLRAGSDVAVVFLARQPALLEAWFAARIQAAVARGATPVQGTCGAWSWRGARDADRRVSMHLARSGDLVVMANSPAQIAALAAVTGTAASLAGTPEFAFFRARYPRATAGELALAVVPDAALRRWCAAPSRVADARRLRAAGTLAGLQAEWIGAGCPAAWTPAQAPAWLGAISIGAHGVRSAAYGDLHFLTPIAELAVARGSTAEAEAYERFRLQAEASWSEWFDPIALQVRERDGLLAADLSVLPLVVRSQYRDLIGLIGGARLTAGQGDLHPCLARFAVALDRDGSLLAEARRSAPGMLPGLRADPLGWLGSTASLYADADPVWAEFIAALATRRARAERDFLPRLPLGLNVGVADPLKLTLFLTALRGMAEQSAPGMVGWETRTHRDIPYVAVVPSEQGRGMLGIDGLVLFYLAQPEGLTLTLNEALLRRAIDRLVERRADAKAGRAATAAWLDGQAELGLQGGALASLAELASEGRHRERLQARAWAHLALLNEWRRLFPGEDPAAVHERLWGVRPVAPDGSGYAWDARWGTMASQAYGHPAASATGPALPPGLGEVGEVRASLEFQLLPSPAASAAAAAEDDAGGRRGRRDRASYGLRARVELAPPR